MSSREGQELTGAASPAGPVLYAFSLGLVAAFNPCGFPLLPAYLMVAGGPDRRPFPARALRALGSGATMTVGFVLVFGVVGALAKAGFDGVVEWVPWFMLPVGAVCVAVGIASVAGRPFQLHLPQPALPKGRNHLTTLGVFGIGYAVASLTCALPLFLVGVADSFTHRGVALGMICGLSYAAGMGLVVTAVALAATGARQVHLKRIRPLQPVLDRLAGAVLALIGAYLVLYWGADLATPFTNPLPVRLVEWVQTHLVSLVAVSPRLTGAFLGAVVVATLGLASVQAARTDRRSTEGEGVNVATRRTTGEELP